MKKYALIKAITHAIGPIHAVLGDPKTSTITVRVNKSGLIREIHQLDNGETGFKLSSHPANALHGRVHSHWGTVNQLHLFQQLPQPVEDAA